MVISDDFWNGKNVFVTGHTGFKGTWLSLWLNKLGANVSGLSLSEVVSVPDMFSTLKVSHLVNDHRGDVIYYDTCFDIIKNMRPNIIFHMAAQPLVRSSYKDPLKTYSTNVIGTANILEAAKACESVKIIIVITTDKCYENIEKDYAYIETDPLGGYDPYSSSKACAEHVASAYYRSFLKENGVGLATVRAGNVIGGGDWSADRLIPDAIKTWSENDLLMIRYPQATRPWQHVLEPLSGYICLAEHLWKNTDKYSEAWNFGPSHNSIKMVHQVVKLAAKHWGDSAKWEASQDKYLHEAHLLQLNSEKAKSMLSWESQMDIDDTIKKTVQWYKEYYKKNNNMHEITLNQIIEYEQLISHV